MNQTVSHSSPSYPTHARLSVAATRAATALDASHTHSSIRLVWLLQIHDLQQSLKGKKRGRASEVGDNVVQNNAQHEGKAGEGTGHEPSSRFSSMILMFEAALPPGSSKS